MRMKIAVAGLMMLSGPVAHAQSTDSNVTVDPLIQQAQEECQAGANGQSQGTRALGACDYAIRSGQLAEDIEAIMHVNRAIMLVGVGDGRGALNDLLAADDVLAEEPEFQLNLSAAYIKANQYDLAVRAARGAIEAGLANPALAIFNQAIALEGMARYREAYQSYLQAAEMAPDNAQMQAQPMRFRWHDAGSGPGQRDTGN